MAGEGGRAALGTVTSAPRSFGGASTGGRRPQRPGAAGRDPTGRRGAGNSRPSAGVNNPLHGLASRRCDCKAGNPERRRLLSPLLPLVKRGKSSLRKRDVVSAAGRSQAEGPKESLQGGTRCSQASAEGSNHQQDTER